MVHEHGPNSLLERVEDGTEDHFIVHDRTWAERNQGERVRRLVRVARRAREGDAITVKERKTGSGTTKIRKPLPEECLLTAAALEEVCQKIAYVSAEIDGQTAAVWGSLQQHVTPAGDRAVSMAVKMVDAAIEYAGLDAVRWMVRRRGDVVELSLDVPEDAPDDLFGDLVDLGETFGASARSDGCEITYRWPQEEPEEEPED